MLQHPGVGGNANVGQGRRRKDGSAAIGGIPLQPKVISRVPLPFSLRISSAQVIYTTFHQLMINLE